VLEVGVVVVILFFNVLNVVHVIEGEWKREGKDKK
jgi:hypothetical protein